MSTIPPPVGNPETHPTPSRPPARPLSQRTRTIRELERSQLDQLERALPRPR
jgi:hypothetical protein